MKKLFSLSALLLLTVFFTPFELSAEIKNGSFTFGKYKGFIQLPANFTPGKPYKFILFFHGRGGIPGTGVNFSSEPFADFRKMCSDKGYIVAVPSHQAKWFDAECEIITEEMLVYLAKELKIDISRFYVMGCSMGGMTTLLYAARHSERVIAACDIFGVADVIAMSRTRHRAGIWEHFGGKYEDNVPFYESRQAMNYAGILAKVPLMVLHGDKDDIVPPFHSRNMVEAIRKAGGRNIEYIEVKGISHQNLIIKGLEKRVFDFFEKYADKK